MTTKPGFFAIFLLLILLSCKNNNIHIENGKYGKLIKTVKLNEVGVKHFPLDSLSAPRTNYTQIFVDKTGRKNFTFFNPYNNVIYFYDYLSQKLLKKIEFDKNGTNAVKSVTGFYIESLDSIYVFEKSKMDLLLANDSSKIWGKISLIGTQKLRNTVWTLKYPQYDPQAAKPFIKTPHGLLFTGQFMQSLADSNLGEFHLVSHIDLKTNKVTMSHIYPRHLYGSNYNWDGRLYYEVYPEILPDQKHLVFSFPISHDLYISDLNFTGYRTVFGGSNQAKTISSINDNQNASSFQTILASFNRNDEYAAIKYDPYRKVYYRFLRTGMPNSTESTPSEEKPIVVVIMDSNFKYLGESTIGLWKNWNIANTFVTEDGLNIEYIGGNLDESFLTLKIFNLKKIL